MECIEQKKNRFDLTRFFWLLLFKFALLWTCCLMVGCVLDPQQLFFPKTEQTKVMSPIPPRAATCYYTCIKKGVDATYCRETCTKNDPTADCYEPCVKSGVDASLCGTKCYNQMDPTTTCYLSCVKAGLSSKICGVRADEFKLCISKGTSVVICKPRCVQKSTPTKD